MDRRTFVTHGSTLLALTNALPSLLTAQKSAPIDSGQVVDGKVTFGAIEAKTEADSTPANPDAKDKRIGFAVVGLGRLAVEQILPAFGSAKHARLVALVSGTPEKAKLLAAQYGVNDDCVYDYAGFDKIRDNPKIDVVYIVLPNSMHLEYTERAAKAGKHVLCEKPMAITPAECEKMISACERADRKLMIAYRMQYELYMRELMRMTEAGELGQLKTIIAANSQNQANNGQWRLKKKYAGGGSLYDIGIYCLNAARAITNEEPVEVSARIWSTPGDPRFVEVEETVTWSMRFPGGAVANLSCSYGSHHTATLYVSGTDAEAVMDPAFPYSGQQLKVSRKTSERIQTEAQIKLTAKDQFALEMDHMALCVRNNVKPRTPGEEGLADIRIIQSIYESAESGRVVPLQPSSGKSTTRGPKLETS